MELTYIGCVKLPDFFIHVNLSTDIDDLKVFPFFTQSILERLKAELPLYLSKADECLLIKLQCWQSHEEELPRQSNACKQVILIQPSSSAAENIFLYLLTQSMKEKQFFGNYLETSIMLQYNSTTTDKL